MELSTDETGETSSRLRKLTKAPSRVRKLTEKSPRAQKVTEPREVVRTRSRRTIRAPRQDDFVYY